MQPNDKTQAIDIFIQSTNNFSRLDKLLFLPQKQVHLGLLRFSAALLRLISVF